MARIAFVAHGLTSPLNASLELSRQLEAAGHQVVYLSHVDISSTVAAHGHEFVLLAEDAAVGASRSPGMNPVTWAMEMRRNRQRSIARREVESQISRIDPDLLLIDIEMHYPIIAAASLGIPTMLVMNWLSVYRLPDLPPLSSDLMPGNDRMIRRAWHRVRWQAVVARLKQKLSRHGLGDLLRPVSLGTRFYADLRQVAHSRGHPLAATTDRKQWLRPYMYTTLPVLCLNAYEFEFPHKTHPNIRYVGPMVNRRRTESRVSDTDALRWAELKRIRADTAEHRSLVYCSLGSYWSDPTFLRTVLTTFTRRRDWDLVIGLGGQASLADLGLLPDNVLALEWAPQLDVLAEADCAINHGGITSINECIASAVPIVVYSPGLLDQDGCAARVEYHGLGMRGDWQNLDSRTLERHIGAVLNNDETLRNVHLMRDAYERYELQGTAAKTVEQFLATDDSDR